MINCLTSKTFKTKLTQYKNYKFNAREVMGMLQPHYHHSQTSVVSFARTGQFLRPVGFFLAKGVTS